MMGKALLLATTSWLLLLLASLVGYWPLRVTSLVVVDYCTGADYLGDDGK